MCTLRLFSFLVCVFSHLLVAGQHYYMFSVNAVTGDKQNFADSFIQKTSLAPGFDAGYIYARNGYSFFGQILTNSINFEIGPHRANLRNIFIRAGLLKNIENKKFRFEIGPMISISIMTRLRLKYGEIPEGYPDHYFYNYKNTERQIFSFGYSSTIYYLWNTNNAIYVRHSGLTSDWLLEKFEAYELQERMISVGIRRQLRGRHK